MTARPSPPVTGQSVGDYALPPSGLSQSSLSQAKPAAAIARTDVREIIDRLRQKAGQIDNDDDCMFFADEISDEFLLAAFALESQLRALERIADRAAELRKGTDDWFELTEFEMIARAASAMSAFGQDPKGLEAKPASATGEAGDAQGGPHD